MVIMSNIYILDEQYRAVGLLSDELPDACPFYKDRRVERLEHAMLTLELQVPANHETSDLITVGGFLVYPNDQGELDLFQILEITDANVNGEYYKKIEAENAAVFELTGTIIRPVTLSSQTLDQIMQYILSGTDWQLGRVDYAGAHDFKFEEFTYALDALHKVMETYGAELKFRVVFDNLTVVAKYIDVLEQRGSNDGEMFEYGKDILEIERIEDTRQLVTAYVGVGSDNLTFTNYNPPADSAYEKSGDWIGSIEARERWSKNGEHIFGIYKDESKNAVELFNNTKAELDRMSKPQLTYTMKVSFFDKVVEIGSTYRVKDTTFKPDLLLEARAIEKTTSITEPEEGELVFGEFRPLVYQPIPSDLSKIQDQLSALAGLGAHVIADGPLFDLTRGEWFFNTLFYYELHLQVTDRVNLDSCTTYVENDGTNLLVELRDWNGVVLETREFNDLSAGANTIKLDFVLSPNSVAQGGYILAGHWDDSFYRFTDTSFDNYPYTSGAFSVIGTNSGLGYWYGFFDLRIGGPNVTGGYGATLRAGNLDNTLGTMEILNSSGETILLADNNQVSIGTASIGQVISESIVNYSDDDYVFYVNKTTGDDENDGLTSSTPLASLARAMQKVPKVSDGQVDIYIQSDLDEGISISGYTGLNNINIYCGTRTGASAPYTYTHYTIKGGYVFDSTTKRVNIFYGRHFPDLDHYGTGSSSATLFNSKSPYVYFREGYISANVPGTTNYSTNCIASNDGGMVYLSNCHLQDWRSQAVRAASFGRIVFEQCTGSTTQAGARAGMATLGGQIVYQSGTNILLNVATSGFPANNGATETILASFGGTIQGTPTSIPSTTTGTSGTNTGTPSTTPTTITYGSNNSGRSYRYTKYIGWRSDLDVREGSYGYGFHKGLWFFSGVGSTPPWVGKTIQEIWVYVIRLNEGGGAGTVRFKTHNYLSQPAGEPTIGSAYVSAHFNFGEKKWVRLDQNATIKAAFQNNTAKGIAIDGGDYAIFSIAANLRIKYV